jgi:hypothetical protein
MLDTLSVTESPEVTTAAPKTENKPFAGPTSAYAGVGQGAKSGLEDKNIVTHLGK